MSRAAPSTERLLLALHGLFFSGEDGDVAEPAPASVGSGMGGTRRSGASASSARRRVQRRQLMNTWLEGFAGGAGTGGMAAADLSLCQELVRAAAGGASGAAVVRQLCPRLADQLPAERQEQLFGAAATFAAQCLHRFVRRRQLLDAPAEQRAELRLFLVGCLVRLRRDGLGRLPAPAARTQLCLALAALAVRGNGAVQQLHEQQQMLRRQQQQQQPSQPSQPPQLAGQREQAQALVESEAAQVVPDLLRQLCEAGLEAQADVSFKARGWWARRARWC